MYPHKFDENLVQEISSTQQTIYKFNINLTLFVCADLENQNHQNLIGLKLVPVMYSWKSDQEILCAQESFKQMWQHPLN